MSFLVCRFGFEYRILQSPSASEALDHILHPLSGLVRRSEGVGWPLSLLRGINSFSCWSRLEWGKKRREGILSHPRPYLQGASEMTRFPTSKTVKDQPHRWPSPRQSLQVLPPFLPICQMGSLSGPLLISAVPEGWQKIQGGWMWVTMPSPSRDSHTSGTCHTPCSTAGSNAVPSFVAASTSSKELMATAVLRVRGCQGNTSSELEPRRWRLELFFFSSIFFFFLHLEPWLWPS